MNRFDKIAKDWDEAQRRVKMVQNIFKAISKKVKLSAKLTVADLGAGTGLLLFHIQPLVKEITAFDSSQGMLDVLAKKVSDLQAENVEIQLFNADTENLPEKKFDLIVSGMTFHHFKYPEQIMVKAFSALKKGGAVAIADLEPEDGSFHGEEAQEGVYHNGFDLEKFAEAMRAAGFENVSIERAHTMDKGGAKYHIFLAYGEKKSA